MDVLLAQIVLAAMTGCYHGEVAEFPTNGIAFDVEVREPNDFCPPWEEGVDAPYEIVANSPDGWVIDTYELPIECPDGEYSNFYVIYPEGVSGAQRTALYFHSGAFDYVLNPQLDDPIGGEHYQRRGDNQSENRLEREWAVERAFASMGMACDRDRTEDNNGALPVALAERGVVMIVAANCWGDLWHNDINRAPNAVTEEYIDRSGFTAAEYMWKVATAPGSVNVALPFTVDTNELYFVGQGEGGRAVTELIRAGMVPKAALIDGHGDDLSAYWAAPQAYASRITGLERLFPNGASSTAAGALAGTGTWPARTAYIYSSLDARVPRAAHTAITTALPLAPGADLILDTETTVHVATAGDIAIARQAADFLTGAQ